MIERHYPKKNIILRRHSISDAIPNVIEYHKEKQAKIQFFSLISFLNDSKLHAEQRNELS